MKLTITDNDIKRSTPPSDGWHLVKVINFTAKKRPAGKEGFEYWFDLEVLKSDPDVKADNTGRVQPTIFYSTGMGFMIPFVAAVLEMPITKETPFEPENFVGKEVMAQQESGVYENKPTRKWVNFAPASGCPF